MVLDIHRTKQSSTYLLNQIKNLSPLSHSNQSPTETDECSAIHIYPSVQRSLTVNYRQRPQA